MAPRTSAARAGTPTEAPKRRMLNDFDRSRISYHDPVYLQRFLTARGRIRARSATGLRRSDQRRLATQIKLARELALLPYAQEPTNASANRLANRDGSSREAR